MKRKKCNDLHMSIKDFVPDERPEEELSTASIARRRRKLLKRAASAGESTKIASPT